MEYEPAQIGKWFIITGLMLCGIGAVVLVLGRFGLFRLPGDISTGGKNWQVFIPITSCIVLSVVLTALMWIISKLLK